MRKCHIQHGSGIARGAERRRHKLAILVACRLYGWLTEGARRTSSLHQFGPHIDVGCGRRPSLPATRSDGLVLVNAP